MSRIKEAFANGKAFIPFITCGDPDLETTEAAVRAAAENGADLIELGIPFSDPTAEGPVIQGANIRALKGGVTTDKIFELVRRLRRDVRVPMVFMTYANVVFSYGSERFIAACRDIGIDGLILPDVPFEEKEEFLPLCRRYGVDLISLIAPTSQNRIARIAREAEGFLYVVSSLGVTGMRKEIHTDLASMIAEKNAEKDQLNEEIASIQANINDLKAQLKEKRAALKAADKAVAKLEAQKTAAEAKAAQQARQAEIDSALQKLISDGMSVDEILNKLK